MEAVEEAGVGAKARAGDDMNKFNPTVGCMCGGMLLMEFVFPGGGWIAGGLLGIYIGWPRKEGNGSDKQDQVQKPD